MAPTKRKPAATPRKPAAIKPKANVPQLVPMDPLSILDDMDALDLERLDATSTPLLYDRTTTDDPLLYDRATGRVGSLDAPADMDLDGLDDAALTVKALRLILLDATASAAAKASAARTLAEINGQLGRNAKPPADAGKPLAEMSREELEAELARETGASAVLPGSDKGKA